MPNRIVDDATRQSIAAIVAYNWADEAADYKENAEDGDAHVFIDLQRVSDWLTAPTTPTDDDARGCLYPWVLAHLHRYSVR